MNTRKNAPSIFLASAVAAAVNALQGRWIRQKLARSEGDYAPAGKRTRMSVAEGKRQARKARNIRRQRLAMKRRGGR